MYNLYLHSARCVVYIIIRRVRRWRLLQSEEHKRGRYRAEERVEVGLQGRDEVTQRWSDRR